MYISWPSFGRVKITSDKLEQLEHPSEKRRMGSDTRVELIPSKHPANCNYLFTEWTDCQMARGKFNLDRSRWNAAGTAGDGVSGQTGGQGVTLQLPNRF